MLLAAIGCRTYTFSLFTASAYIYVYLSEQAHYTYILYLRLWTTNLLVYTIYIHAEASKKSVVAMKITRKQQQQQ